ncbi:MAG: FAD-dependent oxidoreductase [Streptosporangiales bacterium]|nr:FAD-dependent oxidoreductase [Streptosporangiales bacterium]
MEHDFDVAVVGSGFGGSVTALRLAEKGYRVVVLEAGRRFAPEQLPRTSWQLRRFLWAPRLGCYGIQRISVLRDVVVLAGAGVGGGSLVYANTLYEPPEPFFRDPQWRDITDWQDELRPFYDQARRMLGVTENPTMTPSDEAMRTVADQMGVGHTFRLAPVGVWFGKPGETIDDPYFGGAGPSRTGCIQCGSCMTGCRFGAKNTLPSNYLYLAERLGVEVRALTTVTEVRPLADGPGYAVATVRTGSSAGRASLTAEHVVFAAGALGTQRLLHRMRADGVLPDLSPALGRLTRTNSEALLGAIRPRGDGDYTKGVAITSSFHPDEHTHVEPVRYGKGSNLMGLLATVLVDGGGKVPRWLRWAREQSKHPLDFFRSLDVRGWSERTVIALVMQTLDNSLTVSLRRGPFGRRLTSRQGHGQPNPTWIPVAHEAVRRLAKVIGGKPGGTWGDVFNVPMTAHILGGCVIGGDADEGVIDAYHRVYGHPGLHVVDGSAVSANLGVNPSLTITAQAERAMSLWPNRGEPDARPPLGDPYQRLAPVPPAHPAVPAGAPAALRLPDPDPRP